MKPLRPLRSLKSKALQLLAQREQSRLELRRKLMAHALAEEAASDGVAGDGLAGNGAARDGAALDGVSGNRATRGGIIPGARAAGRGGAAAAAAGATSASAAETEIANTGREHGSSPDQVHGPSTEAPPSAADRVDEVLAWLDAHRFQSDLRFAESRVNARSGRYGDLRIRQELKQHGVALDADAAQTLRATEGARAWAVWERRFGTPPATASDIAKQSRFLTARGFSPDTVRQVLRRARRARTEAESAPHDD